MYSAYKLNKQGDNIQPWHTPFPIWNQSVVPCPVLTVASWPAYRLLKRQDRWPEIPISLNHRGMECKCRKSGNIRSHRQIWHWSTEWSRAKGNRVLPRERTGHRKYLFQQHKRRLYTWTSPRGQYWNQVDCILSSQRWRSSIQSAKTRLGADYGSDHELFIAKFRLKLKKVGKTTRPFKYHLNQIPFDYTVEVRNRFKGLDLIGRVPEELWTEFHGIVEEARIKTIPKKMKCRKAKWLSVMAL